MRYRNNKLERKFKKLPEKEYAPIWVLETEKIVKEETEKVRSRYQNDSKDY